MNDLGLLPGAPMVAQLGINNAGQLVGYGISPSGGPTQAFLYSGGVMYDLNSLVQNLPEGQPLTFANAINNRGQIAGGTHFPCMFFLLTPVRPPGRRRSAAAGLELGGEGSPLIRVYSVKNPQLPGGRTIIRFNSYYLNKGLVHAGPFFVGLHLPSKESCLSGSQLLSMRGLNN